jgi:N6-L-threonylcarbamoyladenine synthase
MPPFMALGCRIVIKMKVLGIDTSNYTTSVALAEEDGFRQSRRILAVGKGECGLRQSNALFLHTVNLPDMMRALMPMGKIDAVAYSAYPRDVEGSYMPCFLAGKASAESVAAVLGVPLYAFSHQAGHLMAAVKTCGDENIGKKPFLAFHASGGTTELLYAEPDENIGFSAEIVGHTLDISAGQLVDRVGVMLGLTFPCGNELEKLAKQSTAKKIPSNICVRGADCNISGAENTAAKMLKDGKSPEDVARFAIEFVGKTIIKMSLAAREKYPDLPIIYAGGVMRNAIIKKMLAREVPNVLFADTELSSDNAVGTAYLGLEKFVRDSSKDLFQT